MNQYYHLPHPEGKIWDVGAGGAVVRGDRVLMVRKTYGVGKGRWAIPSGLVEHEELLDEAAAREVFEETAIRAEVISLLAVRTRYVDLGGAVYVVFKMRPLSGEPTPDGVEVDAARYFSAEELLALADHEIFALSRHAALAALRDAIGLVETPCPSASGPAYRAFVAPSELS
ncbi:MAG: NUDIX domain-containing protein [Anaerolineales bacterium]